MQAEQELIFGPQRLLIKVQVRLGRGWEDFAVRHPDGASFGAPVQMHFTGTIGGTEVEKTYAGAVYFHVDGNGTVSSVDTYVDVDSWGIISSDEYFVIGPAWPGQHKISAGSQSPDMTGVSSDGGSVSARVITAGPGEIVPFKIYQDSLTLTVHLDEKCLECETCEAGRVTASLGSLECDIALGKSVYGATKARLSSQLPHRGLASPASLELSLAADSEVIAVDGLPRQVRSANALVDIQVLSDFAYELQFYGLAAMGAQNGDGTYELNGSPMKTVKVENPDASASIYNRLKISEINGSHIRATEYEYDEETNSWTLIYPDSLGSAVQETVETLDSEGSPSMIVATTVWKNPDDTPVAERRTTKQHFSWGWEIVEEVDDPDDAALTTSWEYYTDPMDQGNFGRLKQRVDPTGYWEYFEYDSRGFEVKRKCQYLDSAVASADSSNFVVATTYSSTIPHVTVVETLQGVEVGRSYRVFEADGDDLVRKDIVCLVPGAAWDAADNLVTITKRYDPIEGGPFPGEIKSVRRPDGTMLLRTYAESGSERTIVTEEGELNSMGTAIVKGTRAEEVTDLAGHQISYKRWDIESEALLEEAVTSETDEFGRPTEISYGDGTVEEKVYSCCGLTEETNRDGETTSYTYDALRRLETKTFGGITMIYGYDAKGRQTSVTRRGTDDSEITLQTDTYDLAGRITSRLDALDHLTEYTDTVDGDGRLVRTTTLPESTGTLVEVFHKDGRLKEISGDASYPRKYEYGTTSPGWKFVKEIKVGIEEAETEWTKSYTDMAGRGVRIEYADSATENIYYNEKGQMARRVDADGVTQVYGYNSQGELEEQGIDLDNDDLVGSGDRTMKVVRSVTTAHGEIVRREVTSEATEGGSVITLTVDTTPNERRRWITRFGVETEIELVYDGSGGCTTTVLQDNGPTIIEEHQNGRLMSRVSKMGSAVIGSTTCQYDPHGRRWKTTDGRTSTIVESLYYDTDWPHTVTSGSLTVSYDDYNWRGQPLQITLPGSRTSIRTYWPTGQVHEVGGDAEYPVSYTYDPQGRIKTMTTSSGTSPSSAVTTWDYYPDRDWLYQKTDSSNNATTFTYTSGGRLETRQWARNGGTLITTYNYHAATGDPSSVMYSDDTPDVTSMTYYQNGKLRTVADIAGLHTLTYHAAGMLQSDAISGSGLLHGMVAGSSYDALLRKSGFTATRNSAGLAGYSYGYDGASRLETVTSGSVSAVYGYLPHSSSVETITHKLGSTAVMTAIKGYDSLDRLESISHASSAAGTHSYTYGYNSRGQRETATQESGQYWLYGYNDRGEVTGGSKKLSGGTSLDGYQYGYTFDSIGNRLTAVANGRTSVYTPNAVNEYSERTVPGYVNVVGTAHSSATVAVSGSTASRQGTHYHREVPVANTSDPAYLTISVSGTRNGYTASREGEVFVPKTPESFGYDADGNLTSDGRWSYTWDAENRLVGMETTAAAATAGAPKQRLTFAYDYQSRRISKKVENWNGSAYKPHHTMLYLYDGMNLAAEVLSSGQKIRSYAWGSDLGGGQSAGGVGGLLFIEQQPENKVYSVGYDGNGNITRLYDMGASGALAATYEYGPFGEALVASGPYAEQNPIRWSTKYQDQETALSYYGYRYYSPVIGRWLSRDPIEESGGSNLYGFVANSPVDLVDLYGLVFRTLFFQGQRPGFRMFTGGADGGMAKPVVTGEHKIEETKRRCCAEVVKAKRIDVLVLQIIPARDQAIGIFYTTDSAYNQALGHEERRKEVYRSAYYAYIDPVESDGAQATKCGKICRNSPGQAKLALLSYLDKLQSAGTSQFKSFVSQEQSGIGKDTWVMVGNLYDHYSWIYQPQSPPPLKDISCPSSN